MVHNIFFLVWGQAVDIKLCFQPLGKCKEQTFSFFTGLPMFCFYFQGKEHQFVLCGV